MIPAFPYVRIPPVIKKVLKKNLRESVYDETFIVHELGQDPALKLLLLKYFTGKAADLTLHGLYRYYGWDYLRKIVLSLYIYRIAYGSWPKEMSEPYIDSPFNFLEEELSHFAVGGSFRGSLLALYLRLMELKLYQEHRVTSFNLVESCAKTVSLFAIHNHRGIEVDIAALQLWHLGEYYSWDILAKKISKKTTYPTLMEDLSIPYRKTLTANMTTYLLSIGDEENFGLEARV